MGFLAFLKNINFASYIKIAKYIGAFILVVILFFIGRYFINIIKENSTLKANETTYKQAIKDIATSIPILEKLAAEKVKQEYEVKKIIEFEENRKTQTLETKESYEKVKSSKNYNPNWSVVSTE